MSDLYVAWRMAVRRVWRVPWTSHCNLLPHLAGVIPPELSFAKRAIAFIRILLESENKSVRMITGMGLYSSYSFIGKNFRYLMAKYEMNIKNVLKSWNIMCKYQEEQIRISDQVKELCFMRDNFEPYLLERPELINLIGIISTE